MIWRVTGVDASKCGILRIYEEEGQPDKYQYFQQQDITFDGDFSERVDGTITAPDYPATALASGTIRTTYVAGKEFSVAGDEDQQCETEESLNTALSSLEYDTGTDPPVAGCSDTDGWTCFDNEFGTDAPDYECHSVGVDGFVDEEHWRSEQNCTWSEYQVSGPFWVNAGSTNTLTELTNVYSTAVFESDVDTYFANLSDSEVDEVSGSSFRSLDATESTLALQRGSYRIEYPTDTGYFSVELYLHENVEGVLSESFIGNFTWSGTPTPGTATSDWFAVPVPEENAIVWIEMGEWTCIAP
jgi:hypothetical protein